MEKAELKLRLADVLGSLADAKVELLDVQDALLEKDKKIAELTSAFEKKDELVRRGDAYYTKDEHGKAIGKPYCLRCWESDHKQRQLVHSPKEGRVFFCTACGCQYDHLKVIEIQPKHDGSQ